MKPQVLRRTWGAMRRSAKSSLPKYPALAQAWGELRGSQLRHQYIARREAYAKAAARSGLVYRQEEVEKQIRGRLEGRGYVPRQRRRGDIHTFTFIPRRGWHSALIRDLCDLGPVTEFDYMGHGYEPEDFLPWSANPAERRREMNALFLKRVREAHDVQPIDWIFVYASGLEVRKETLQTLIDEVGVPIVNMCLDDKQSWTGPLVDGQHLGQIDLAPLFDLSWTSARVACEWYLADGGRPIYLPEGFDAHAFRPMEVERDISVSFVGAAYGFRPSVIKTLRRYGIDVETFGPGWPAGSLSSEDQVRMFNRSLINLGMGGILYSESLTNVKARDFEIPGTGGGVYLTTFNPDLAQHFAVGEEILCYSNREEMVELIRYYLAHPIEASQVALRGHQRSLSEHRWLHRYLRIASILGILDE
jgi:glycosyl transferase family 1